MSKRVTVLSVQVEWDDEKQDHPIAWHTFNVSRMRGHNKVDTIKVLSYEDFDENGNQIGAG